MTTLNDKETFVTGLRFLIQLFSHEDRLWILKNLTKYVKVTLVNFDKYGC